MAVNVDHRGDGVAIVTLLAESAQNAFSIETMNVLSKTINSLLDDKKIKAFILTGTGKFFCSGADINEFKSCYDNGTIAQLVHQLTSILHPLLIKIRQSDTIYVAALNGAAAGGGLGLALAADYRIASPNAKMAAAFFSLGLSPDGGTTWLLPRLVGNKETRKFFFDNETWSASKALDKGAIDEIVQSELLIERSIEVAKKWGFWAPTSKKGTKKLLDLQTYNSFPEHLKIEQQGIVDACQTKFFAKGVEAFLDKKTADFNDD